MSPKGGEHWALCNFSADGIARKLDYSQVALIPSHWDDVWNLFRLLSRVGRDSSSPRHAKLPNNLILKPRSYINNHILLNNLLWQIMANIRNGAKEGSEPSLRSHTKLGINLKYNIISITWFDETVTKQYQLPTLPSTIKQRVDRHQAHSLHSTRRQINSLVWSNKVNSYRTCHSHPQRSWMQHIHTKIFVWSLHIHIWFIFVGKVLMVNSYRLNWENYGREKIADPSQTAYLKIRYVVIVLWYK